MNEKKYCEKVIWVDKSKISFQQSDGKTKVWRMKGFAYDPKHRRSTLKDYGDSVLVCMVACETGSLIIIDQVTHNGRSNTNSKVYRNVCQFPEKCLQTD